MEISPVFLSCIMGATETDNHIFLHWDHARNLWQSALTVLSTNLTQYNDVQQLIRWVAKQQGKNLRNQIAVTLVMCGSWELWTIRNAMVFERQKTLKQVCEGGQEMGNESGGLMLTRRWRIMLKIGL